jgi:hypothetical protein
MSQAEHNLGPLCVPYAALIAAYVTFDPASMGRIDLEDALNTNERFNPNVRMAALSRLKLNDKNSVSELTSRAASELSFSIPAELRQK